MSVQKKIKLGEGEELIAVVHRSALAAWWLYTLGAAVLTATALFTFWLFAKGPAGYVAFILGLLSGASILISLRFFEHSNFLAITSDRLVDVDRASWFREIITSIGYLDLKEALVIRHGFFPTVFRYGTVVLSTRDNRFTLEIERVPAPERVQALLMKQKELFKKRRREESTEATFHGFIDLIPELTEAQALLVEKKVQERLTKLLASPREPR